MDFVDEITSEIVTNEFKKKVLANLDIDKLAEQYAKRIQDGLMKQVTKINPNDFCYITESILDELDTRPIVKFVNDVIKENFS